MENHNTLQFDSNSAAVTTVLNINAGIINRLADNSNVCKTLAISMAGVVIGLSDSLSCWQVVFLILLELMFLYLDSLYMGLIKRTKDVSCDIINAAKSETTEKKNPYLIEYRGKKTNWDAVKEGFKSSTVWPFYLIIIIGLIVKYFI